MDAQPYTCKEGRELFNEVGRKLFGDGLLWCVVRLSILLKKCDDMRHRRVMAELLGAGSRSIESGTIKGVGLVSQLSTR